MSGGHKPSLPHASVPALRAPRGRGLGGHRLRGPAPWWISDIPSRTSEVPHAPFNAPRAAERTRIVVLPLAPSVVSGIEPVAMTPYDSRRHVRSAQLAAQLQVHPHPLDVARFLGDRHPAWEVYAIPGRVGGSRPRTRGTGACGHGRGSASTPRSSPRRPRPRRACAPIHRAGKVTLLDAPIRGTPRPDPQASAEPSAPHRVRVGLPMTPLMSGACL